MTIYRPMLASNKKVLLNSDWIYEIKYDGCRAIAYINNKRIKLINRSMIDITDRFPEITSKQIDLPDCVLDGELVCFNYENDLVQSDFQLMQTRMNRLSEWEKYSKQTPAKFMVFDILEYQGKGVCDKLLQYRKVALDIIFNKHQSMYSHIHEVETLSETQAELVKELQTEEGLVAKNIYSTYIPGARSPNWIKLKFRKTEEFYISKATKGVGKRANTFGALDLYQVDEQDFMIFRGQVGTGFSDVALLELDDIMNELCNGYKDRYGEFKYSQIPFKALKIKVSYLELSNNGIVRQASFEGIV